MYHKLLTQIAKEMKRFGRSLQPPCSSKQVRSLQKRALKELGNAVPEPYIDFLKSTNGFFWNGLLIYGSERAPMVGRPDGSVAGYVEENLGYWECESLTDYLIFGDDGVVFYTYHISSTRYQVILKVGLTVLGDFDTFDKLLSDAFKGHL